MCVAVGKNFSRSARAHHCFPCMYLDGSAVAWCNQFRCLGVDFQFTVLMLTGVYSRFQLELSCTRCGPLERRILKKFPLLPFWVPIPPTVLSVGGTHPPKVWYGGRPIIDPWWGTVITGINFYHSESIRARKLKFCKRLGMAKYSFRVWILFR